MPTSKHEKIFGVFDFITKLETYRFDVLFSTINEIAQKEVISFRRKAVPVINTEQIGIL